MLTRMAGASGVATPSAAALKQFDREREGKQLSDFDWASPSDPARGGPRYRADDIAVRN